MNTSTCIFYVLKLETPTLIYYTICLNSNLYTYIKVYINIYINTDLYKLSM